MVLWDGALAERGGERRSWPNQPLPPRPIFTLPSIWATQRGDVVGKRTSRSSTGKEIKEIVNSFLFPSFAACTPRGFGEHAAGGIEHGPPQAKARRRTLKEKNKRPSIAVLCSVASRVARET